MTGRATPLRNAFTTGNLILGKILGISIGRGLGILTMATVRGMLLYAPFFSLLCLSHSHDLTLYPNGKSTFGRFSFWRSVRS